MTSKDKQIKKLENEVSDLRTLIEAYDNLTILREKEINDSRSTIDAFEKVSSFSKQEIEGAKQTIRALESTLGLSNREFDEAKSTIEAFEHVSELQDKEIDDAKSTIDAFEKISEFSRQEFIELVERVGKMRRFSHPLQKRILKILGEDNTNESHILVKLNLLKSEDESPNFYSHLFYVLTNLKFDEITAKKYWEEIIELNEESSKKLGRRVSFRVSLLDYFIDRNKQLRNPKIIEFKFYESVMEIESDLETARLIQEKLFPKVLPEISGYKSIAKYKLMEKVGGDFYDYKKSGDLIKIFMADVSGHGLVSSYLAQMAKMSLDSVSGNPSPSDVLKIINDTVTKYTVNYNYITAYYAEIDTKTNIISYSNAGHVPPLLYRKKSDEFFELRIKGQPLGWFEELDTEENTMQLQPGDRLIVYTDGITECENPNEEMFGVERFKDFLKSNIDLSLKNFSTSLIKKLIDFSERDNFSDDLAYIVIDVL